VSDIIRVRIRRRGEYQTALVEEDGWGIFSLITQIFMSNEKEKKS
jgi:transcription initiation factor IIF auxiliary subunit